MPAPAAAMDRLFELYLAYYDRLVADFDKLNRRFRTSSKLPIHRMSRAEFADYLNDERSSAPKRLFLQCLLQDEEGLLAALPEHLQSLVKQAA